MLRAESVCKTYPGRGRNIDVLRGIDLEIPAGGAVALMGPSGSGKSTLLSIIGTLESPTSGQLTVNGEDPFQLSEDGRAGFRNRRIGFIFQDHHLLPQCTVLENVILPTLADSGGDDATSRATELLDRVGLSDRMDHRPEELSGGERQRVAIARAMINRPVVLLADEPTGNLDRSSADTVTDLLLEMHAALSGVLIVVTHSARLASRFERRFELDAGRLVTSRE
ncbi:MAG: ABC transporter ATP-binding protein [Phycisphaerales bacterium]|nr:ABC transporter ATP-binding protein [Phycisphaerales bacterium]